LSDQAGGYSRCARRRICTPARSGRFGVDGRIVKWVHLIDNDVVFYGGSICTTRNIAFEVLESGPGDGRRRFQSRLVREGDGSVYPAIKVEVHIVGPPIVDFSVRASRPGG
jgi:hypothetical protein